MQEEDKIKKAYERRQNQMRNQQAIPNPLLEYMYNAEGFSRQQQQPAPRITPEQQQRIEHDRMY